ncbi:MAG: DegT/DnrJ/EryC1/StrS family aminotransferase [Pseudomonadota bacterium]
MLQTSAPHVGPQEMEAMARAMASGYFGMGPETRAFEAELAAYLGGGLKVCAVATGSAALHLALAALDIGPEDEVLVPALTFVASFQAVAVCGARAVACDVLPHSGLIDLEDAGRRLTPRTRAIMPVHYAGYAGDLAAVYDFARTHGLRVVEDAAHAWGSRYQGRLIGSQGDIVCFSFDPIKNITAGQGGAVVTGDEAVARRVGAQRDLGMERPAGGPEDYTVVLPGWRYGLSDLMAAVGRAQLARFDAELKPRRQSLAALYRRRLQGIPGLALLDSQADVVPHIQPVLVSPDLRDRVAGDLAAAGVQTRVHYRPGHGFPLFDDGDSRPVAESLYRQLLSLPLHPGLDDADVLRITDILCQSLAGAAEEAT